MVCIDRHILINSIRLLVVSVLLSVLFSLGCTGRCGEILAATPVCKPAWQVDDSGIALDIPISSIKFGSTSLPVRLRFASYYNDQSSLLGRSWKCTLVDSVISQLDETTYRWISPDGQDVLFRINDYRDSITSSLRVKGATTQFSFGGIDYVYQKGRLLSASSSQGQTLRINRDIPNQVDVTLNGQSVLSISRNSSTKDSAIIRTNGSNYTCSLASCPVVKYVSGFKVVSDLEKAIGSISIDGAQLYAFDYSVDEQINPCLSAKDADGVSYFLKFDPQTLKPLKVEGGASPNKALYFKNNSSDGFEDQYTEGDGYVCRCWFTSGTLFGKERWRFSKHPDGGGSFVRYLYDEKGSIIKTINNSW